MIFRSGLIVFIPLIVLCIVDFGIRFIGRDIAEKKLPRWVEYVGWTAIIILGVFICGMVIFSESTSLWERILVMCGIVGCLINILLLRR